MKFNRGPFNYNKYLRTWYSIELFGYRLGLQLGDYNEFYYWHNSLLKKRRLALYMGELILTKVEK